ncbi:MAG: hypothetical protein IT177_11495 [Acidobacteria bacterium]|nr:hypothetical protein [Acidobacteriota bacterium]
MFLAAAFACLLFTTSTAFAQDVPFAFLIENGWQSFYAGAGTRSEQGLTSWYGRGQVYAITNGQKGAGIGTAHMHAFTRTVPDPTFAALGPLAGLIVINLGPFRGHLTVFETPAGLQTAVAILDPVGETDIAVSGSWVFGNGAAVAGGTANDMVVGGIAHFGAPLPAANVSLSLSPYFPLVPFNNDLPFHLFSTSSGLPWPVGSGSSYQNSSYGPLRTYMRGEAGTFFDLYTSAVTVLHTGGGNYAVLSCSWYTGMTWLGAMAPVPGCSLSGTGVLSRLTGRATSYEAVTLQEYVMRWQAFLAP